MDPTDTALLAGLLLAFGLISKRLDGTVITAPMVAVALGLVVGPSGLGLLHLSLGEGLGAKLLLPELSWWEAATLGAVLAPTDAALGQGDVGQRAAREARIPRSSAIRWSATLLQRRRARLRGRGGASWPGG